MKKLLIATIVLLIVATIGLNATSFEDNKKACDSGNANGCFYLGISYEYGRGLKQDTAKAMLLYTKACNEGHMESCCILGSMYQDRNKTKQDYTKTIKLYTKACNSGYMEGCNMLGVIYSHGEIVEKDSMKAMELYTKACNITGGIACSNYELEKKKLAKEEKLYMEEKLHMKEKKACDSGDLSGCSNLGSLYYKGLGVKQ